MTKLSVNINKIATLRNARGGHIPDVIKAAKDIQNFGADGITVHPRPDERHIRYDDVRELKKVVHTEFNVEGNPIDSFLKLVEEVKPDQVTLVPDPPGVLTSNAGWDTIEHKNYLKSIISGLKKLGIRSSIFVDPIPDMIKHAQETGVDRVELYTEAYAREFHLDASQAISNYILAARTAEECNIGVNAGHDLDLDNLGYFKKNIPNLLEVSIGHALISDALYLGLENVVNLYKRELR